MTERVAGGHARRSTAPLEFNIIFVPGTVRYLGFFVWSLLKWSNASFRLVSNGCRETEQLGLKQLCRQHDRLEYQSIPTSEMLPHGLALNHLQAQTTASHFCFIDSDILAVGAFLETLASGLTEYSAVFSGTPSWLAAGDQIFPESFISMSGDYSLSASGLCLGSTYVALYDNRVLTAVMRDAGLGFEERNANDVPSSVRPRLAALGFSGRHFDTGKLLVLLLQSEYRATYVEEPALRHLGGLSFESLNPRHVRTWRTPVRRWLRARGFARIVDWWHVQRATRARLGRLPLAEARLVTLRRFRQRDPVRRYFLRLLGALCDGQPFPPPLTTGLQEIDARVDSVAREIIALHKEFSQSGGVGGA